MQAYYTIVNGLSDDVDMVKSLQAGLSIYDRKVIDILRAIDDDFGAFYEFGSERILRSLLRCMRANTKRYCSLKIFN
jgi:hypothetical protein